MFIYSLDNTITADLAPKIGNVFDSVAMLPWLSVGFMIGASVGLLPIGKLYAKYDAKWVYVINIVFFLGASALCGAAPNMNAMIVGRVFLGVAGSAVYCGIMTLITISTDDNERPAYFSISGVVWSVGTVLGPVVGGAFERIDWRWSFYLNLIIGGIFIPIYIFILPSYDPLPKSVTWRQRAQNFDFVGTVLFTGACVSLIMGINFGGVLYAWNGGSIIALFVTGGVLAIAFGVQQYYSWLTTPADRIFPASLFRYKEPVLLAIATVGSNTAAFIPIFYIPVYFQFAKGDSALEAAVRLLPLIIVFSFSNLCQGFLMARFGYYWPWFLAGGILEVASNVMLYCIDTNTTAAYIYGAEIILAIGTGLCNQAAFAVILSIIPPAEMALGIPFIMISQYAAITAGLSIAGAVFTNQALQGLSELLPTFSESQLGSILSGTSGASFSLVPEGLRGAAIDIIVDNLRKTSIPAFFGGAMVLLVSIFLNKTNKLSGGVAIVAG